MPLNSGCTTSGVRAATTNARFVEKSFRRLIKTSMKRLRIKWFLANTASSVSWQRSSGTMKTTASCGRRFANTVTNCFRLKSCLITLKSAELALKSVLTANASFSLRMWKNIRLPMDSALGSKLKTREVKSFRKIKWWKNWGNFKRKRRQTVSLRKQREKNKQEQTLSDLRNKSNSNFNDPSLK